MAMSFEDFLKAYPAQDAGLASSAIPGPIFAIDTGDRNANRLRAAQSGVDWHSNVRDLVASLVTAGVSDVVIKALAPSITLPGYTVRQTEAELVPMITGARRKGFGLAEDREADGDVDPLDGFTIVSAQELSAKTFPPIEWLIKLLLPRPCLTMLAGPPKVGKSWLCLFLALQVAEAGHEVVYIASEDNELRLQSRLAAISPFPPSGIHFIAGLSSQKALPKGDEAHTLIRALKVKHPALECLVVDTLASIRAEPSGKSRKDEYALSEEEFSGLRRLAHDLDLAIVLVHHTRKATDSDASPVETILGSQGIAATVETIMVMRQEVGSRNAGLYITGKDVEQQELVLPWQGPGFGWPREMTEARLGSFQQKCLDFIRSHPRCMQGGLVAEFGCDKSQVSGAVAKLLERGLVERQEGGHLIAK